MNCNAHAQSPRDLSGFVYFGILPLHVTLERISSLLFGWKWPKLRFAMSVYSLPAHACSHLTLVRRSMSVKALYGGKDVFMRLQTKNIICRGGYRIVGNGGGGGREGATKQNNLRA